MTTTITHIFLKSNQDAKVYNFINKNSDSNYLNPPAQLEIKVSDDQQNEYSIIVDFDKGTHNISAKTEDIFYKEKTVDHKIIEALKKENHWVLVT